MSNKGRSNHFFIAVGIVSIGASAFVGLLSPVAFLGIPAGVLMIWAAFPEKPSANVPETEEPRIDPTKSRIIGSGLEI